MGPRHSEVFEGAVIGALQSIDNPLKTLNGGGGCDEGVGGGAFPSFNIIGQERIGGAIPDFGFKPAHAAEMPCGVNESLDQEPLGIVGGAVLFVIFRAESGEVLGAFVEHALASRDDVIGPRSGVRWGFALGGAGSGRYFCDAAVGRAWFAIRQWKASPFKSSRGGGNFLRRIFDK